MRTRGRVPSIHLSMRRSFPFLFHPLSLSLACARRYQHPSTNPSTNNPRRRKRGTDRVSLFFSVVRSADTSRHQIKPNRLHGKTAFIALFIHRPTGYGTILLCFFEGSRLTTPRGEYNKFLLAIERHLYGDVVYPIGFRLDRFVDRGSLRSRGSGSARSTAKFSRGQG